MRIAARRVARLLILTCVLCMCPSHTLALDPALDASQYAHTAWRISDGSLSNTTITSFAQTPNGYLWLSTSSGLLRFDGVRTVPWQLSPGASLPDQRIRLMLAGRDGTLWIGTVRGLASWQGGALVTYPQLNGMIITGIVEDREGKVWVGAMPSTGNGLLCAIHHGRTECHGEDGRFGSGAVALYEDSRGVLWVGAGNAVWQWTPGSPVRHRLPDPIVRARKPMSEAGNGALLIITTGGIRQLVDGTVKPFVLPNMGQAVDALSVMRDRDGALWIGTPGKGLIHVHEGRADTYRRSDGLSGDWVFDLFEDREGNIWATTFDGIDRFRALATTTYSLAQGLPGQVYSVLADGDGTILLKTAAGLYRWHSDGIRAVIPMRSRARDAGGGHSLFRDRSGRIWMGGESELGLLKNGRFVRVGGMPRGTVDAITEDSKGNLWVAHRDAGILRVSSDRQVHRVSWPTTKQGGRGFTWRMIADPVHGGVWIRVIQGVAHLVDGEVRASYDLSGTLGKARINDFRVAADGTLWIASDAGLVRLKAGHIAMLDRASGLPCDQVDSTIEDDHGSLWLYTACGIASVLETDLAAWTRSIDMGQVPQRIQATLLDASDGVRLQITPIAGPFSPHIAKARDGKLWFATVSGVTVVDPRRPLLDKLVLPVHVEQIIADRKAYDASSRVGLPPLVRDLQIDYTATTLSTPEKTVFRYKLEDHDRDWQDAGTRRQAFYNDLRPGKYRFRVIAADKSGVWNKEGATLDFTIAPAYWQTWWFRAFCVVALLMSLWGLYRRRVRQLGRQFNMTLEARVAERTRIARELHDTLLQSFHGLLLRFQTVQELFPKRPTEAQQLLASAIDQAAEAITEGRDAVQGLRGSTTESRDLAAAIRTLGDELAAEEGGGEALRVEVHGAPRSLHPTLHDEVFRIAGEALRNAFRHAEAKQIEVELHYDARYLRLRVRDDGKGNDPAVLRQGGREGHFGIRGMRERATLIGGTLTVWSAPQSGTEVELSVPSSHAYTASSSGRGSESTGKLPDEGAS